MSKDIELELDEIFDEKMSENDSNESDYTDSDESDTDSNTDDSDTEIVYSDDSDSDKSHSDTINFDDDDYDVESVHSDRKINEKIRDNNSIEKKSSNRKINEKIREKNSSSVREKNSSSVREKNSSSVREKNSSKDNKKSVDNKEEKNKPEDIPKTKITLKSSYEPMFIRSAADETPKKKEIIHPVFYELFLNVEDNFWKTVFINFAIGKFHHGFGYSLKYENRSNFDFHHTITFRKGKKIIKQNLSVYIEPCIVETQIFITNNTSMIIPKESLYFIAKNILKEEKDVKNKKQQNRQQNKKSRITDYIRKVVSKHRLSRDAEKDFRSMIAKYHLSGSIPSNFIVYDKNESIEGIRGIGYNEDTKMMEINIPFKKTKKSKPDTSNVLSPTFQRDKSETSSTNLANKNWKKYLENMSKNSKFIERKFTQTKN
jgi:hypothetical protein